MRTARLLVPILMAGALAAGPSAAARPKAPPPFTGELRLDMTDPVIDVKIGEVPLRLRVALDQKRLIELNPDAADRLAADPPDRRFRFDAGFDALVGRETLKGVQAAAPITLNGRRLLVTVASHGRDCCAGVDGEIGIGLLPYATIRFSRPEAGSDERSVDFLIDDSSEHGPQAATPIGRETIFVQFSLHRQNSVATAAAGAMLAAAQGGHLTDGGTTVAAFGVERPISVLHLDRAASVAGFRYLSIAVRTADFGGRHYFPADPNEPRDIVVRKKVPLQEAWPVVLVARDRLDRCGEALFDGNSHVLTLRCAFEGSDG
ncbi:MULTISPECIES: hypothetical protein [unclassified Sphingomonas]|uniref:hypothetical protein n=1 Tax=unclassified Sphingomonas TaxID=196159 RepID=UPI0012E38C77|nr:MULTISPECIES: hypothetical protein [unclassified Sphingomonas]